MSRKREIKVYLPEKMVGELEGRKRLGTRSKFMQEAIQFRINKVQEFDIWQLETMEILDEAVSRIRRLEPESKDDAIIEFLKRVMA